ncbi:MAG: M14 family metallopeptidase [Bacteroidota bacterium]|nr:M14 family metallopeptidase [Bacteroidota bacterium]
MKKYFTCLLTVGLVLAYRLPVSSQNAELFFKAAGSPANPKVQASWNKYYTYDGITELCRNLAKSYPNLVTMESAGKSYKGRDIIALTITDKNIGKPDYKPGFYIDGNIHSNEIQGTEMALYTAWYLCEMYNENKFISDLLKDKVFYILPTINPDARQYFMDEPNTASSPRSGLVPMDNDRDGLYDEDPPDDLNHDGIISMMRRKSPFGTYNTDPSDPRKMVRVAPGEKGEYELLGLEGIDNDGDGLVNEDGVGGYDPNRDYGFNWEPAYIQQGSGKYPFSFPENQAVRDFSMKHRNITGAQSFHNSGGLILRGPSIRGGGAEVFTHTDENVINSIGLKGQKIIAGYKFIIIWKDMYPVYGGELDWWYGAIGSYVFSNELWNDYLMYNDTTAADSYEFDRLLLFEDAFVPWQEVDHPVYGKVEVGGFNKNFGRIHPGFLLESDAHRNAAFCIYNAWVTPKLEVRDVKVKSIAGGLKEVTATIVNSQLMPTHSGTNLKYRIDPPDYVYIDGGKVIAGMLVIDKDRNITREQKDNPQRLEVLNIDGYQHVDLKWIVRDGNKFTVRVESVKGGRASGQSK